MSSRKEQLHCKAPTPHMRHPQFWMHLALSKLCLLHMRLYHIFEVTHDSLASNQLEAGQAGTIYEQMLLSTLALSHLQLG